MAAALRAALLEDAALRHQLRGHSRFARCARDDLERKTLAQQRFASPRGGAIPAHALCDAPHARGKLCDARHARGVSQHGRARSGARHHARDRGSLAQRGAPQPAGHKDGRSAHEHGPGSARFTGREPSTVRVDDPGHAHVAYDPHDPLVRVVDAPRRRVGSLLADEVKRGTPNVRRRLVEIGARVLEPAPCVLEQVARHTLGARYTLGALADPLQPIRPRERPQGLSLSQMTRHNTHPGSTQIRGVFYLHLVSYQCSKSAN